MSEFGVTLGSLYIKGQGYVAVFQGNMHGMSCSGTCCILGEAWFQGSYGDFWMNSCQLMFPGVSSSLVFSSLDLSLLPLAFSLILSLASRLLHPCSTNDKTSRLMGKRFFTVTENQKG